jgi:hypothetical protein
VLRCVPRDECTSVCIVLCFVNKKNEIRVAFWLHRFTTIKLLAIIFSGMLTAGSEYAVDS